MSLRLRIVLLVLLAIVTPAALLGFYLIEERESEIVRAKQSLGALAAFAAENLGDKVSGTVQMLHGLSRAPDLNTEDKAACSQFLVDVLKRYPQYTGLLTIRPDGKLHCDSLSSGRTLDLNDRAYFRQARAGTEPTFEVVFGRNTGVAVLQVAYPARDSRGELLYVLLASLNLAQFSARIATASPHTSMEVMVWDNQGTVMARYPDDAPKKLAGSGQPNRRCTVSSTQERPGRAPSCRVRMVPSRSGRSVCCRPMPAGEYVSPWASRVTYCLQTLTTVCARRWRFWLALRYWRF